MNESENNSEYLSKERLEEIEKQLENLKTNKRKEVAGRLEYAKSLGDLSENSEYKEAKEQQSFLEDKIAHFEDIIRRAVIIVKHKSDIVCIGSSVQVKKSGSEEIKEYRIVGPEETDIPGGKISNKSPLGSALLGRKKGEIFKIVSPNGEIQYKIIKIS